MPLIQNIMSTFQEKVTRHSKRQKKTKNLKRQSFIKTRHSRDLGNIRPEVSQKEKHQHSILMHTYEIYKDGNDDPIRETAKETQMYRTVFWTLWEKARLGWFERIALKHVYYHMWNRLPVLVWFMRQGAQGWCTGMTLKDGMGWGGIWEGGSGWGTYVHSWMIHVNVWQKPPQYCN